MNSKAIKALKKLVSIEGLDRKMGSEARNIALTNWINEYVVNIQLEQNVIKTNLNSEESDYLKYHLAYQMGDKLMEDCIEVTSVNNMITTRVMAIKR